MQKKETYLTKEHSGFEIKIHFEQDNAYQITKHQPLDKKYNVKIRKQDLILIDCLAKDIGSTRSHLINNLIESFLMKGLNNISEPDIRALIAETADNFAHTEYESSWQETILQQSGYIQRTIEVMKKCNEESKEHQYFYDDPYGQCQNSSSYKKLSKILKAIKV